MRISATRAFVVGLACVVLALTTFQAASPAPTGSTVTIDLPADAATMDPGNQYDLFSEAVYDNIFDALLAHDAKGAIVPFLATKWTAVTPTTWVFQLRTDVKFADGEPLDAQAVKVSLDRILSPAMRSPQFPLFARVTAVTVRNAHTVEIDTKAPFPTLLALLTNLRISPASYATKDPTDVALHPIGDGPYTLVSWTKGSQVVLAANPSYWRGKPSVQRVVFRIVPTGATRLADLESGQTDLIFQASPDDVPQIRSHGLKVIPSTTERIAMMVLNTLDGLTRNKDVRAAIALAIDRDGIDKNLFGGQEPLTNVVLMPQHFGYTASVPAYPYDVAKAKQLLAAAGYAGGMSLQWPASTSFPPSVMQAIQSQLQVIGITAHIQTLDGGTFLRTWQRPDRQWGNIGYFQWSCACLDADGVLNPVFHSGSIWSSYANPQVDRLLDQAGTSLDSATRIADYAKINQILHDDYAVVPLWPIVRFYGADTRVSFTPRADELFYVFDSVKVAP